MTTRVSDTNTGDRSSGRVINSTLIPEPASEEWHRLWQEYEATIRETVERRLQ